MRRRTLLMGAGGIGSLLFVGQATQGIDVRIVETNDPVQAGDFLEVVAEVTNASNADQRPSLEFYVGDTRLVTHTFTIPAGETETAEFSHLTYPVVRDVTFPVSIRTASTVAERTVEVIGIAELDDAQIRPTGDVSVPPETAVLFEVETDLLGEYGGRTRWYLDEQFSGWSQGPWYAAYFQAQGRDHWTQTFTAEGTYGVAASIQGDDENRTARWRVDVTQDAAAAPTIQTTRPERGPLDVSNTQPVDLEATVASQEPLDRAVWWLAHADLVLGVEDLSGTEDTTSLSTDQLCHGCPIVLWVIDERGAVTEDTLWTPRITFDGESQLSIVDTNAPVEAGGVLEVTVESTNATDEQRTETLELVVGDEVVDTRSLTLDPNATHTATLGYETYPVETDVSFPILVRGAADRDSTTVDVYAMVGPAEISILDANDPVLAGDRLEVEAEVTNTHDATITDQIHLFAGDRVDTTAVTLEPDESRIVTLGYDTYPVAVDVEFPIEVSGDGARDHRTVQVFAEALPSVRVTITGTNAPVAAGEFLEVVAQVTNAGGSAVTEDVSLVVGGERVDSSSVSLSRDQSKQVTLGYETYPVRQAVEFPVTVEADSVSDRRVVAVSPNEGEKQDDGGEDDEQQADPSALALVDYYIIVDEDTQNEYITFRNTADKPLDLSGWRVEDDERVQSKNLNPYRFPSGFTMAPGATVTLVTGDGTNTENTLYWGIDNPIWDQDGDVVTVFDNSGNIILEAPISADEDDEAPDGDGESDDSGTAGPVTVTIDGTNAPVTGGEQLTVQTTLTNDGAAEATRTVELVVGGEIVDSRSITIPGGESQAVQLGYSTYPVQQDVSFDVTVRTGDDSAVTTVNVSGTSTESTDGNSGSANEAESGEGEASQSEQTESAEGENESSGTSDDSAGASDTSDDSSTADAPSEDDASESDGANESPDTDTSGESSDNAST